MVSYRNRSGFTLSTFSKQESGISSVPKKTVKRRVKETPKKTVPAIQQPVVVAETPPVVSAPAVFEPVVETGVQPVAGPAQIPQINFIREEHHSDARKYATHYAKPHWQLVTFTAFLIFSITLMQMNVSFSKSLRAKVAVQEYANLALDDLKEAQALIEQKDFAGAQDNLESAQKNFLSAKEDIADLGVFVNSLMQLTTQGRSAQGVLEAGNSISTAGMQLNSVLAIASQIKISPQGFETPEGFYETVTAMRKYLGVAIRELKKAEKSFAKVDPNDLPEAFRGQYEIYKEQLSISIAGLEKLDSLSYFMQRFIGKDQKSFLILFQNNNELRATGGFIGTYGFYKLQNGRIVSQKISSVYDLDGQIVEKIAPPGPFYAMTNKWGLRDSNWFVDFKESARKASSFYEMTGKETPDAVIGLTPDLFIDLLKLTGPIHFPKYNLTLDASNFRELIQLHTSVLYDKEVNTPKQMLADFAPLLLQKLSELPGDKTSELFSSLIKNFSEKNILIYDRSADVQNMLEQNNWAGRIVDTDRDYLAVFSTNLGGRKTDLAIAQRLMLESEVQSDGSIINTITYRRDHVLDLAEQAKNVSYIRFLVPHGSELIAAEGFTKKPFYPADGSAYPQDAQYPFRIDSDLKKLDAGTTVHGSSGMVISTESGKTEFANWIDTDPGQSSVVKITYKLPFKMKDMKRHSLVVQKQPGNPNVDFSYVFWGNRPVVWSVPQGLKLEAGAIRYNEMLRSDLFIGTVLGNN